MKPVRVPERGDPLVRRLFEEMNQAGRTLSAVSRRAGVARPTIQKWRDGQADPTLSYLRACFEALGYELEIRPKKSAAGSHEKSAA